MKAGSIDPAELPALKRHLLTIATVIPPPDRRLSALRRFAVSITIFTALGHVWLGFEQSAAQVVVLLATAYALDLALESTEAWAKHRRPRFLGGGVIGVVNYLLPSHIAALSVGFLIYSGAHFWPYMFAVAVAVGSKYIFRARIGGRVRHFMNPSNLGIAVGLTAFPTVIGPAPMYHFTTNVSGSLNWIIPAILVASGTLLNVKLTRRGPLIAAWLLGMLAQAILRGVLLPDQNSMAGALAFMTGVAFLLFTNYMITDPGTTPHGAKGQIMFGLGAAAAYGILVTFHVVFGLFYCVVIVCALRGLYHWVTDRLARRSVADEPVSREQQPRPDSEWSPEFTLADEKPRSKIEMGKVTNA